MRIYQSDIHGISTMLLNRRNAAVKRQGRQLTLHLVEVDAILTLLARAKPYVEEHPPGAPTEFEQYLERKLEEVRETTD